MKICPNCQASLEDYMAFCDKCGTRIPQQETVMSQQPVQPTQPVTPVQPQITGVPQGVAPVYQPATAPKKGMKWWQILLIVLGALLVMFIVIGIVADDSSSSGEYNHEIEFSAVEYTKGLYVDGTYTNDWADMRIATPFGWEEGTSDEYAAFEGDGKTECGLVLSKADGCKFFICFEKLTGLNTALDEEDYLDVLKPQLTNEYKDQGIRTTVSAYTAATVGGKSYKQMTVTLNEAVIQRYLVRKEGQYIIMLCTTTYSDAVADSVLSAVQPY